MSLCVLIIFLSELPVVDFLAGAITVLVFREKLLIIIRVCSKESLLANVAAELLIDGETGLLYSSWRVVPAEPSMGIQRIVLK